MPQRRKIHAAPQKQTRKKSKKWVQNQKLRQPHVEKAHPHVEKAQPPTWKKLTPTWKKLTAVSRCEAPAS
jgi:hypothetical protein